MNKIEIIINPNTAATDSKKTAAFPRRRPDPYGRRRLRRGIRFYDLSMVNTGPGVLDFAVLDYDYPIPTFATDYDPPEDQFTNEYDFPSGTEYNGLISKIAEQPVETWASYYKKLTPAMDLGITIDAVSAFGVPSGPSEELSNDNPNFKASGLVLSDSFFSPGTYIQLDAFQNFGQLFPSFVIGDTAENKITATLDINADEVAFAPSKNMDVFVMPRLNFHGAWLQFDAGPDRHLNEYWIFYPREALINPVHPIAGRSNFNVSGNNLPPGGDLHDVPMASDPPYDPALYQEGLDLANWFMTLPDARMQERASISSGAFSGGDPEDFLNGAPNPPNTEPWFFNAYFRQANINLVYLRAVVRQNGNTFYIWNSAWA